MSWYSHARRTQRTPLTVIELDLDYIEDDCQTITATNSDGSLCYRTPSTTNQGDVTTTVKTRRFMETKQTRPLPELNAIPCLKSVSFSSEEIRVGKAIGTFGTVTFELEDFVDDDRREDPFYSDSSRDDVDHSAGTYLTKLRARNPYWTGRAVRVLEGWSTDGGWYASDTLIHHYYVRDVQGVSNGRLRVTAVGPLQQLNLHEKEVPEPSTGTLAADISDVATAAQLDSTETADTYPASGHVRIGDEYIAFTRSGVDLTLTRAQGGTEASSHSEGDTVQICKVYTDERVTDIIIDVLTTYGGISSSQINTLEFDQEFETHLSLYTLSGIISKPEKILDIVRELLEAAAALLWWDAFRGQIRFAALRPSTASKGVWTDKNHFTRPVQFRQDMAERVSRSDVYLDLRTATSDPKTLTSYRTRLIGTPQGEADHGSEQLAKEPLRTRWIARSQVDLAVRASNQITSQLRDGRKLAICEVSAKDANRQIGEIIDIKTQDLVDQDGNELQKRYVIEKREPIKPGETYRYTLEEVPFGGRYAYLCPTGTPDYASASDAQRDPGWFLSPADNEPISTLDPAYQLG